MFIFGTRNQTLGNHEYDFRSVYETLISGFEVIDICIEQFCKAAQQSENEGHRILAIACYQTLIRARAYALGCYSVCLQRCPEALIPQNQEIRWRYMGPIFLEIVVDSFHPQVSTLLRPLAEALDLIIYLRQDPTRAHFIYPKYQKDKLAARCVAKAIGETLKPFRDYLNSFASQRERRIGREYDSQERVKADMRVLFSTLWMIARQAAECLSEMGWLNDHLSDRVDYAQQKGLAVFQLAAYL